VRGPVLTNEYGQVFFDKLPDGHFSVLAFPGGGRGIFHLPGAFHIPPQEDLFVAKSSRGGDAGIMKPRTPPVPEISVDILTYVNNSFADELPRVIGQVVDAATGQPLAGAFVSLPPSQAALDAYLGYYSVSEDVTGADGAFHVARIPFAVDPVSGDIVQVQPLLINKEGYAPEVWFYDRPQGDENLDIGGVVIGLPTLSGLETGELAGRIVFEGAGVADLPVAISYLAGPEAFKSNRGNGGLSVTSGSVPDGPPPSMQTQMNVGVTGKVACTDADGDFRFTALAPGWYAVHVAFQPDDGFTPARGIADGTVLVDGQLAAELGPLPVVRTIRPVWPPRGWTIREAHTTFRWTAVAEADSYGVFLDRGFIGTVATNEIEAPEPWGQDAAHSHSWWVVAEKRDGTRVGTTDGQISFYVIPVE
jgi:hypothetical protein